MGDIVVNIKVSYCFYVVMQRIFLYGLFRFDIYDVVMSIYEIFEKWFFFVFIWFCMFVFGWIVFVLNFY